MPELHPAIVVLVLTGIVLTTGLPLVLWFGLVDRRDVNTRLWFGGLASLAIAVLAVASLRSASWISGTALAVSALLFVESMRREAGKAPMPTRLIGGVSFGFLAAELTVDLLGVRLPWGVVLTAATTSTLNVTLLALLVPLIRERESRGLMVAALGVSMPLTVSAIRAAQLAITGKIDNIFSYAPLSNAALIAFTVGGMLAAVGYMLFSNEKNHRRILATQLMLARLNERREVAESHAAALQEIVAQRDQMIMLSSRFSAVSSLAMLNSALVHEISQPLQALTASLDVLGLRAVKPGEDLREGLAEARALATNTGRVLASLRELIAHRDVGVEIVHVGQVIDQTIAIAHRSAEKDGIEIGWSEQGAARGGGSRSEDWAVRANRVLLERLIMNLIVNAMEALREVGGTPVQNNFHPAVRLSMRLEKGMVDTVIISVRDNGPGFPPKIIQEGPITFNTTKAHGIGLGLALGRTIVESWGGWLGIHNWTQNGAAGACVEIFLPLAQQEAAVRP